MIIVLASGFSDNVESEYLLNSWDEIEEVFDSVDWNKFHIFSMHLDEKNSLDISGNTSIDGLSGSLTREGKIHIIPNAPENLSSAKSILKSFFVNIDVTYEKYFKEIEIHPIRTNRREDRFFRWIMVLFFSSIILIPIIYFSWNDLKFIGRDSGFSRAKVIEVKLQSYGGRFFWQNVRYEYAVDGMSFTGTFIGDKRKGYTKVGDEFKVRYLLSDPAESDVIGRFVKNEGKRVNSSSLVKKPRR